MGPDAPDCGRVKTKQDGRARAVKPRWRRTFVPVVDCTTSFGSRVQKHSLPSDDPKVKAGAQGSHCLSLCKYELVPIHSRSMKSGADDARCIRGTARGERGPAGGAQGEHTAAAAASVRGSATHIMFLGSNSCWVHSGTVRARYWWEPRLVDDTKPCITKRRREKGIMLTANLRRSGSKPRTE